MACERHGDTDLEMLVEAEERGRIEAMIEPRAKAASYDAPTAASPSS